MDPSGALPRVGGTLAVLLCLAWPRLDVSAQTPASPSPELRDLTSIGQLEAAFDRDRQKVRVLLLLSPT